MLLEFYGLGVMSVQLCLDLSDKPVNEDSANQLCLNLGETASICAGRKVRPIPSVVSELFELSPTSPTGLVWKKDTPNGRSKAGDVAGTRLNKTSKYFLVSVLRHGSFYTHRIVYYLHHEDNPGSMVVRHMPSGELILGYQDDNLKDNKGMAYTTRRMYRYRGSNYNLKQLCLTLNLNYNTVYSRMRKSENATEVLIYFGLTEVIPLF